MGARGEGRDGVQADREGIIFVREEGWGDECAADMLVVIGRSSWKGGETHGQFNRAIWPRLSTIS